MEENFEVEIISPEKIIFSDEASIITVPSYEGDMDILKNHVSIISFLRPGIIKIQKIENSFENFFVEDGILEYFGENLVILSSTVINVKNISKKYIDNLTKETEEKLTKTTITDSERYILNHKKDTLQNINI
tara:strand:+ start:195 stop:590 length:396 start_codon:yes stop_codon:yes gene_type:complete